MLQHDRQIRQIRKGLVKKVLDSLAEMREKDEAKYLSFWKAFGRVLKEGPSEDYENKDKIADLLLFQSSHEGEKLSSLAEYAARMNDGQEAIYYLTGASRAATPQGRDGPPGHGRGHRGNRPDRDREAAGFTPGTIPTKGRSNASRRSGSAAAEAVLQATTMSFTSDWRRRWTMANERFRTSGAGRGP